MRQQRRNSLGLSSVDETNVTHNSNELYYPNHNEAYMPGNGDTSTVGLPRDSDNYSTTSSHGYEYSITSSYGQEYGSTSSYRREIEMNQLPTQGDIYIYRDCVPATVPTPTSSRPSDDKFIVNPSNPVTDDKLSQSGTLCSSSIAHIRNECGIFVNDERFQNVMIALIVINSIMMGVSTFDFVTDDPAVDRAFHYVDNAFLLIYTVEGCFQLIHHGSKFFDDGWLLFDFVIIGLSWTFSSVQVIRAFRILRALRLISHVQVMRDIVVALLSVIPRMIAIGILLNIVMYIFGVMFTHLFKTTYAEGLTTYPYFSTLGNTIFTLFQIMTLDGWSEICLEVQTEYEWAWLPFVSYAIVSGFVMVNLIIAVICDAIADLQLERFKNQNYFDPLTKVTIGGGDESGEEGQRVAVDPIEELRETVAELETDIVLLSKRQEVTQHMMQYIIAQIQTTKNKI